MDRSRSASLSAISAPLMPAPTIITLYDAFSGDACTLTPIRGVLDHNGVSVWRSRFFVTDILNGLIP
jgi:hypothetical protein